MTLDRDVEQLLRNAMHSNRTSFKETLNRAVRSGLGVASLRSRRVRFSVKARPMGLRAGIDPAGFNQLADELESEAIVAKILGERPK